MFRQLLILVAVVAVALAHPEKSEEEKIHVECAAELGYDNKVNDRKKHNCYVRCLHKKNGIFDEKDELVLEKLNEKFKSYNNSTENAVKNCSNVTGEDECETVVKRFGCVQYEIFINSEEMEKQRKMRRECKEEVGMTDGEVDQKKQNCFIKCLQQKQGIIDEKGAIILKTVQESIALKKEDVAEAVRTCEKTTALDECEQVREKIYCLQKEFKSIQKNQMQAS